MAIQLSASYPFSTNNTTRQIPGDRQIVNMGKTYTEQSRD